MACRWFQVPAILMDVLKNLTELRDMVRRSVDFFKEMKLSSAQASLLEERKRILGEIEADIERLADPSASMENAAVRCGPP